MKIGIDFDGVLTDFVSVAVYQTQTAQGTWRKGQSGKTHKDCKSLNLWECDFGITKKQYDTWFKGMASDFWADLPMLCTQEDIDAINKVSRWHSVYALTDTPCPDAIHQRNLWLFNNGIEDVSVIPTSDKQSVVKSLDITAMLDDSPKQLAKLNNCRFPHDFNLYHPIYPYNIGGAGEGVTSITDYLTRIGVCNE